MSDLREREAAIKRAPVRCPECNGIDIVAGDPTGFACDGCGAKRRLKDFRRHAWESRTPEEKAKDEADTLAFLDRYNPNGGKCQ